MMDIAEKLRKAAGLFVDLPSERAAEHLEMPHTENDLEEIAPQTRTVEQIVREAAGPNLDEIQVPHPATPPGMTPDGKTDFAAIYAQAGLPTVPFSAEQMRDMLNSLPAELPLPMRRQTMKVTLNAMGKSIGATSDGIVADASRKMAALAAYAGSLSEQTKAQNSEAEREIAALQTQIEDKRRIIDQSQAELTEVVHLCNAESDHLDDVLEFFSLDVPPSKHGPSEEPERRILNG